MQQRYLAVAVAVGAVLAALSDAGAQTTTQVVTFQVVPINRVAVTGAPAPLVVNTAVAGLAPSSVSASGGSYAITTNESNKKITASVDQALPQGVSLEVALDAPSGASSVGSVTLGTAAADVVTGISATSAASLPITYRLSAAPNAPIAAAATRTVTFTIVSGS